MNTTYAAVVWTDGKFSDRKLTLDEITELYQQKSAQFHYASGIHASFEAICEGISCDHVQFPGLTSRTLIVFYSKPNIKGLVVSMLHRTFFSRMRIASVAVDITSGEFYLLKKLYYLAPNNEDLLNVIKLVTQTAIVIGSSHSISDQVRALDYLRKADAKQAALVDKLNSAISLVREKYRFAFTTPRSKLSAAEIRNIAAMLDCA